MANTSCLGGFHCSRITLICLNALYIVIAFILIGLAAYAKAVAYIVDISVMGGIISCGVFLLVIASIGVVGTVLHHQVTLFFVSFSVDDAVQFVVACACLAIGPSQQKALFRTGWYEARGLRGKMQHQFDCCGAFAESDNETGLAHPPCNRTSACCQDIHSNATCCTSERIFDAGEAVMNTTCPCKSCWEKVSDYVDKAVKMAGGCGLFFSFTEIVGVWLAYRYRNLKNPSADPHQFL